MKQPFRHIASVALVALVLGAAAPLRAQPAVQLAPGKALTQYVHDVWTRDDGLPVNRINAVLQTRDGYLWMGTQEGLVRFDGIDFDIYTSSNSRLASSDVTGLYEDSRGRLWAATHGGGVSYHQNDSITTYRQKEGLNGDHVIAVAEGETGDLWVASTLSGLNRITADTIVSYRAPRDLPSDAINTLFVDRSGNLWIATRDAGIVRFGDDHFTHFDVASGFPAADVVSIFQDRDGALWFGTRNDGLVRLQHGSFTRYTEADGLPSSEILAIEQDTAGSLWIGTARGGLTRMIDGRFETMTPDDGLSGHTVLSIEEDAEGSLWVGTQTGGLNRLRNGKFTTYTTREGLAQDAVYSIHEDAAGNTWFGMARGGASWLDTTGSMHTLTRQDGLPSDFVTSVASTRDGSVWLGTIDGGLARYRDGHVQTFAAEDGLPGTSIYALYEDDRGRLWVGTGRDGLAHFDDGRFVRYTTADGLSSDAVTSILQTRDGDLWVGTFDGGVNRLRDGRLIEQYTTADGLGSDFIISMHEDADGQLWLGTAAGLSRLRDGRAQTITTRDGLFNDRVFAILEDAQQRLWMSCNRGLFYVERRHLDAFLDGQRPDIPSVGFDEHDGLLTTEFNGGTQPAGWKSTDGSLWFSSAEGAVRVDPDHLPLNSQPPPVAIVALRAGDDEVELTQDVTLAPGRDQVAIQYAGLSYIAPEEIEYQYMLEGVDRDWVDAGTRRSAFYTNLAPGTYAFRVKARNLDGVWSTRAATLAFELQPFFYQTTWFLALCVLALLGGSLMAYRLRVRHLTLRQRVLERQVRARTKDLREEKERTEQAKALIEQQANRLREMDRIKTQFFNNISHEFRTPLTLNIGPLENALSGDYGPLSAEMRRQTSIMLRNSRRLLRLINQLLDLSKLDTNKVTLEVQRRDFVGFARGVLLSFSAFAEKKRLQLQLDTELDALSMHFDPQALEKVLFNLLSNAVKFTPEGGSIRLELRADASEEAVEFAVHDTGAGIPADELPYIFDRFHQVNGSVSSIQEGTGIGLALVHELVHLHGGTLRVESEEGSGTSFFVRLPLDVRRHQPGIAESEASDEHPEPPSRGPMIEMAVFDESDASAAPPARPHQAEAHLPAEAKSTPLTEQPSVLVVDDNPDIRQYVASCLHGRYEVVTAENGRRALEQIERHRPDLIVSDVSMPEVDGYELCRRVRANETLQHLPIILVTSRASVENKLEGLDAGADDYLTKPFNARELQMRVRNLLTLRAQQQALLDVNDTLQEVIDQKTNLLQIAAHDIRNPVGSIRELAKFVREEIEPTPSTDELLEMIETSADQAVQIITQMLEAEALDSPDLVLHPAPLDVCALVRDVLRRNESQARQKGQRLAFDTALTAAGCWAQGDADWLGQAVDNLVSNAIKYSPHDSPVAVSVETLDDAVRIAVRDEGPGLSEEDQQLLFRKFQRLTPRPTGGEASTGLGLAIVKQIAERHGGRAGVASTLGRGSTFFIELPLADEVPA